MARTKMKKNNDENVLHLTKEAYEALQLELQNRIEVVRAEIAEELAVARELGDLSENHAYQVAMEKREFNENRIIELEGILAIAQVVEDEPVEDGFVNIGDTVMLENLDTKEKRELQIVGSEESMSADSLVGKISADSPVGSSLIGKKVGDVISVEIYKKGVKRFKILKIK